MKKLKKALSTALTATLLASLLAIGAVGTVSAAAHDSTGYLKTCVPASCSVVADGISTIVIHNDTDTKTATGVSLYATISGATFAAAAGEFTLAAGVVTAAAGAVITTSTDSITVRAPSAPGTATISIYEIPSGGGNATLEGTFAVTFYSASGLAVSEANSTSTLSATSAKADGSEVRTLTLVVKNANGDTLTSGVSITTTITPVGLIAVNGVGTYAQTATDATSAYVFDIKGSGIAGVATIGISVTYAGVTTSFAPKTISFTGALASITATNGKYSIATGGTSTLAVLFTAKDANGNRLATTGSTVVVTGTVFTAPANGAAATTETTATTNGDVTVTCGTTAGSGTIAIKNGTVTSNAVTVICAGAGATITVAFDKTSVAPGGTATYTATVKDSGGRPVADGTAVTAVANSGAVVDPTDGNTSATTSNGVATFTYIAPNSTGVATVTSFEGGSGSASASITVGAAAGTADSALGVTTSGPFSTSTKVQSVGKYVTFRFDFGAAAAGKTVTISHAVKTGTTWSSFTVLTARVANSSGVVYFYARQSSASWHSYRATETSSGAVAPARQARWI